MQKFKITIEQEIDVEFGDPDKAKQVYLGDNWKSAFFDFEDLAEVAEHLSFAMAAESRYWNSETRRAEQFVDGFGSFVWKGHRTFELAGMQASACGGIVVDFGDREITDMSEIEESTL